MRRSVRMFLVGLFVGIGGTLAVSNDKIALVQTEEGFRITCKTQFIEKHRELPRQIREFVTRTWQE